MPPYMVPVYLTSNCTCAECSPNNSQSNQPVTSSGRESTENLESYKQFIEEQEIKVEQPQKFFEMPLAVIPEAKESFYDEMSQLQSLKSSLIL